MMENPFVSNDQSERVVVGGNEVGISMSSANQSGMSSRSFSYSDVAERLIKDRLWLTALELHTELIETGREIPRLKEFFSNPSNFEAESRLDLLPSIPRSSSQATLDSLDMTRFSEDGDGRGVDERVAVLEFELRKAKETISGLRANLTLATSEDTGGAVDDTGSSGTGGDEEPTKIRPHEQRALNFLINEYLLRCGYKLTSITFTDEVDQQDLEDWDDVGLNMCRPPELIHLYRNALKGASSSSAAAKSPALSTSSSASQTQPLPSINDFNDLKEQIENLQRVNASLTKKDLTSNVSIGIQCEEISRLAETSIATRSDISGSFEEINNTECEGSKNEIEGGYVEVDVEAEVVHVQEKQQNKVTLSEQRITRVKKELIVESGPLTRFDKEVWRCLPELKPLEGLDAISDESLVLFLGDSLQSIISALPINNKEVQLLNRVIPLLVSTIALHPQDAIKDNLVNSLLSLKKRPSEDDRSMILSGLVVLCRHSSFSDANEEPLTRLLTSCWEFMADKYSERRTLVAQACAYISPLISVEMKSSLLVSILKQLKEDRDEGVRAQALTSLSVIACSILEDKYSEIETIAVESLQDRSDDVVDVVLRLLLPVVARRALHSNRLDASLFPIIISSLQEFVLKEEKDSKIINVLNGLVSVLPHVVMFVAGSEVIQEPLKSSTPLPSPQTRASFAEVCAGLSNPVLFYDSGPPVGVVMGAFDFLLQQSVPPWPELTWLVETMIPNLLDILNQVNASKERVLLSFVRVFAQICAGFGTAFTRQYVQKVFSSRLEEIESALISPGTEWPFLSIIPVYILGVLAPLPCMEEELSQTISRLVISLGMTNAPLDTLKLTVAELSKLPRVSSALLTALWQGVVHQRASVKLTSCRLLSETVSHSSEQIISTRIIPALVTLASDPETVVRVETLSVYSLILERTPTVGKEVLDKTYLQIQSLCSDPLVQSKAVTIIDVAKALGRIAHVSDVNFLQDVILVELEKLTRAGVDLNLSKKSEVAAVLVEVFSNLIYLDISKNSLNYTLIPTLRVLEIFCKEVLPTHVDTVSTMIRETEARITTTPTVTKSPSLSLGVSPSNVEEMKQKVTKIFNTPISKPQNLQNLFWKK